MKKLLIFLVPLIYCITSLNFPVYAKMNEENCETLENWIVFHYKKSRTAWDKLGFDSSKKGMSDKFYFDGFSGQLGLSNENYKYTPHSLNQKKWNFHEKQATDLSSIYSAVCK